MIKLSNRKLLNYGHILLSVPALLFMTWYKWYFAIIGIVLIMIALLAVLKTKPEDAQDSSILISPVTLTVMFSFIVFACAFSGIGGVFPQSGDNIARNPIFHDLITKDWPVLYPEMNTGLSYYMGFWLLPALIGKLFGKSFFVGNIALILTASLYITVTSLIIITNVKIIRWKQQLFVPVILTIFGGINFIGATGSYFLGDSATINIINLGEQYTTIPGAIYVGNWCAIRQTFHHFLPALLGVCLYVYTRNRRNYLYQAVLLLITSPFAVLALGITMLADAAFTMGAEVIHEHGKWYLSGYIQKGLKLFSIPNLCAIPLLFLILPYYMGTSGAGGLSLVRNKSWFLLTPKSNVLLCICILFAECGLLLLILWDQCKKEFLYWISGLALIIIPFLRFAGNSELQLKVSSVWLIILMLLLIAKFHNALEHKEISHLLSLNSYLVLCGVVFLFAISATLRSVHTYKRSYGMMRSSLETFEDIRYSPDFSMSNYLKRNPAADLFFGKLSCAAFDDFDGLDLITDENNQYISKIVFTDENIDYASIISNLSTEALKESAYVQDGLYQVDLSNQGILREDIVNTFGSSISGNIINADVPDTLTAKMRTYAKGEFVHITFKNIEDNILFPYEYTNRQIGIRYAYYDTSGEIVGNIGERSIDCILLPGEEIRLTIPININAPRRAGNYTLRMWSYNEEEDGNILLEETITIENKA